MSPQNLNLGKLKSYAVYTEGNKIPQQAMLVTDEIVLSVIEKIEVKGTYAILFYDSDNDKFYVMSKLNASPQLAFHEFFGFAKGYILGKDKNVTWNGKDMVYNIKLPSTVENGIIASGEKTLCFGFILEE